MKKLRLWAQIPILIMTLSMLFFVSGMFAAQSAAAQTKLPSFAGPIKGTWQVMHHSSFQGTTKDLLRQCQIDATDKSVYQVTAKVCHALVAKTLTGEFTVVYLSNKDKLKLSILHGLKSTKSHRWFDMLMKITKGGLYRAQLYDLGNGVYAYWFTGDRGVSCNNLGWVFLPPPEEVELICVDVPFDGNNDFERGNYLYLNGVNQQSCCCDDLSIPSLRIYSEGSYEEPSNGSTEICYPVETK